MDNTFWGSAGNTSLNILVVARKKGSIIANFFPTDSHSTGVSKTINFTIESPVRHFHEYIYVQAGEKYVTHC